MSNITRTNIRASRALIAARKPFAAGGNAYGQANFRGGKPWENYSTTGRLSDAELKAYEKDANNISFVVYSYSTPIAWYSERHGWHIVNQKFSPSTSRHQSAVRLAIA